MDNLGDWLYIVFLIVAAVSGLFGSGKKEKRQTEVLGRPDSEIEPEPQKPPQKSFWEMLEEMQEEKPKAKSMPAPQPTARPVIKSKDKQPQTRTPFLNTENQHPSTIKSSPELQLEPEDENSVMQGITFTDAEDLKKAVIYSEIFNRKY